MHFYRQNQLQLFSLDIRDISAIAFQFHCSIDWWFDLMSYQFVSFDWQYIHLIDIYQYIHFMVSISSWLRSEYPAHIDLHNWNAFAGWCCRRDFSKSIKFNRLLLLNSSAYLKNILINDIWRWAKYGTVQYILREDDCAGWWQWRCFYSIVIIIKLKLNVWCVWMLLLQW